MIYINLPEFYSNYSIINFLSNIPRDYFKIETTFSSVSGNFPYCYWNGGFNNNINSNMGKFPLYQEMIGYINEINIPIRFNCSNIYLTDNDLLDEMGNLILELGQNGGNQIAISNISFYEKLKEKFPNYSFIFSREANLIYPMTPEIINTIIEQDIFKLIEIPVSKTKDLDFIKQIKNRKKIEIQINSLCRTNCNNFNDCKYHEHYAQYNYSGINNYFSCNKKNNYSNSSLISFDDIINIYYPLGIKNYSIASNLFFEGKELLFYLLKTFIKEDKIVLLYEEYMRGAV